MSCIIKNKVIECGNTSFGTYSCVPKFVHDDRNAVSMVLSEDAPKMSFRICVRGRDNLKMGHTLEV